MAICWYCHWGWYKPVAEIYNKAVVKLNGHAEPLHYGPSHVVWDDENFDSAEFCLENFDRYIGDYSNADLKIVRESLEELAKIPLDVRCPEPDNYDGEHPELYPPPKDIEMIRIKEGIF